MSSTTPTRRRPRVELADERIAASEVYSLASFQARTGLGRAAIRACRRAGLSVVKVGSRNFIAGRDWIEFLESQAANAGA